MNALTDKKKVLVIAALGVVLLSVGAFQFSRLSGAEAQVADAKAPAEAAADAQAQGESITIPTQVALVSGEYPERDPFKPQMQDFVQQGRPQPARPVSNPIVRPVELTGSLPGALPGLNVNAMGGDPFGGDHGFPYRLAGVIVGVRPAAVFVDAQGTQRLVTLNGELDGDTRVVEIDRMKVVLRHGTRTVNLTLGGNEESEN